MATKSNSKNITHNLAGKIIVIEGASDSIGKTTQYQLLQERLKANGVKLVTHHFPTYYAYQGKAIEMYLSGKYGHPNELSPYFINSLYVHDRAVTWYTKLKTEFEQEKTILLDRYTTSSLIYQSALIENPYDKKAFLNYVTDFEYDKLGIRKPDQVIFLHAPFELINQLRAKRTTNEGVANDIHEQNLTFMRKVYQNAMSIANYFNWEKVDCATPDGTKMRSVQDIHAEIYRRLTKI